MGTSRFGSFSALASALLWCCITSPLIDKCSCQLNTDNSTPTTTITTLEVDLSTYNSSDPSTHVFSYQKNLTEGIHAIRVINAPQDAGFFIVQTHSLYADLSLSLTLNEEKGTYINGKNIGLVQQLTKPLSNVYEFSVNSTVFQKILLMLVVYGKFDPIPGGCNMEFPTEIAPYQILRYNDTLVQVDVQPASFSTVECEHNPTRLTMYHAYLGERDISEDEYFSTIVKMATVEGIKTYARYVPESSKRPTLRRIYGAYPGVGSIFAVVASYGKLTSAYVPVVTYACNIDNWDTECVGPVSVAWKILCSLMVFLGLFTCYFGHRFFKTQMFIFGFVFGGFLSFVSASLYENLSVEQGLVVTLLFGSIYGCVWIIFWWRFGRPILSVFLPVAFIGYLTSCLLFYYAIGDFVVFQSDINFWMTFFGIAFPITVFLLVTSAMFANILASSFLGATAVTISLDHYIGGNLRYLILNNIRRACVYEFKYAVIDPPFQYRDGILCLIWLILVISGVYVQLRMQRGKAPFPPPISTMRLNSELTPLLSSSDHTNTV